LLSGSISCDTLSHQKACNCFISLAKTSPEVFDDKDLYREEYGDVVQCFDAMVWLVANKVFGSHWSFYTKPTKTPAYIQRSRPQKGSRSVGFSLPESPVTTSSPSGFFIHHTNRSSPRLASRDPVRRAIGEVKRQHATFVTLTLPQIDPKGDAAREGMTFLHKVSE